MGTVCIVSMTISGRRLTEIRNDREQLLPTKSNDGGDLPDMQSLMISLMILRPVSVILDTLH